MSFEKLKRLFAAACELDPTARTAYLNDACEGDAALRGELEELLLLDRASASHSHPDLSLSENATIEGHHCSYRIEEEVGRGSMGVVYRAWDCRLERRVALKFLRSHVLRDATSFFSNLEREAKLLARLNHPNIATLLTIDECEGVKFLVLEFVEGASLTERIGSAGLTVETTLTMALQITSALAAAHDSGVIHRDLKPDNVIIGPEDRPKVLDFGIARAAIVSPARNERNASHEPSRESVIALLLGTPGYMSPEQIRGEEQDARSDIFSFGCLLYECLTGTMAFAGDSIAESIASVLSSPPDWSRLLPTVPAPLRDVLRRCVEKDKEDRPASIACIHEQLLTCQRAKPSRFTRRAGIALLGLIILTLCVVLWSALSSPNLRVTSLRIEHLMNEAGGVVHKGAIGEESFTTSVGDWIQITLELSEPAYSLVLAFNPDGEEQLCLPTSPSDPPSQVTTVHFPRDLASGFRLTDGRGQQVFVVFASRDPLPSYAEFRAGTPSPAWRNSRAGGVWRFDRTGIRLIPKSGFDDRGAIEQIRELGPLKRLWQSCASLSSFEVLEGIAFPVEDHHKET